jgi:hypothetical protein
VSANPKRLDKKPTKTEEYESHSIETETSRDPEPSVGNKRGRDDSEGYESVGRFPNIYLSRILIQFFCGKKSQQGQGGGSMRGSAGPQPNMAMGAGGAGGFSEGSDALYIGELQWVCGWAMCLERVIE